MCASAEFIMPSNRPEGVWSVLLTGVSTQTHTHTHKRTHTQTAYCEHSLLRTWRNVFTFNSSFQLVNDINKERKKEKKTERKKERKCHLTFSYFLRFGHVTESLGQS